MIDTSDKYLLMIEPALDFYTEEPLLDSYSVMAEVVFKGCRKSKIAYKGVHTSTCGYRSDNHDYTTLLGRLTHSLMPHYVKHFRKGIPAEELEKLRKEYLFVADHPYSEDPPTTRRLKDFFRRAQREIVKAVSRQEEMKQNAPILKPIKSSRIPDSFSEQLKKQVMQELIGNKN